MSILEAGFGRLLHDRNGVSIHQFHELMVVVYRTLSVEGIDAVGKAQRELHGSFGQIAGLSVLRSEALTRPDLTVREHGQKVSDEFDRMAYASAIVLSESGMGGAFYRSILTGIHLASRRPVPQRVFASTDDAVTWILGKNPESPLAPRLVELQRRVSQLVQKQGDDRIGARGR